MSKVREVRIDKYLWSVRLYKTRSTAADACKKGRVFINNVAVKPSRAVETGDIIILKKLPATYSYKVKEFPPSRIPAKLVSDFIEDITPEEEKIKLKIKSGPNYGYRSRGAGRPTKRERRNIDRLKDDSF
ncbi:MAG: RNA-binding S4 domain-containing protein [Bacteroidales bacterium]|nr:RNA-binding S4 domain-containing protein [Bacteroidales bacterium]